MIVAKIEAISDFETLKLITNNMADVENWAPDMMPDGINGVFKLTVYKPTDADLENIIAACQGALERRRAAAESEVAA
ncbi:MAG: hypothetical protein Q8R28_10705 [Dehalococcoidia bacterium]|nr:hypothetical protein [Dehalococcoidia bacterium]